MLSMTYVDGRTHAPRGGRLILCGRRRKRAALLSAETEPLRRWPRDEDPPIYKTLMAGSFKTPLTMSINREGYPQYMENNMFQTTNHWLDTEGISPRNMRMKSIAMGIMIYSACVKKSGRVGDIMGFTILPTDMTNLPWGIGVGKQSFLLGVFDSQGLQ